jgi:hypothetical protein
MCALSIVENMGIQANFTIFVNNFYATIFTSSGYRKPEPHKDPLVSPTSIDFQVAMIVGNWG